MAIYIHRQAQMHICTYTHTQYTHRGVNGMGCIGWGAPAAEAPGRVRRSGTLPTICKGESRHVQQVPPATIFMKLLTAAFGFHQAWQWEPQLLISLHPYLQCCRPFKNPRSPNPPFPPQSSERWSRHAVVSTKYITYCGGNTEFPTESHRLFKILNYRNYQELDEKIEINWISPWSGSSVLFCQGCGNAGMCLV